MSDLEFDVLDELYFVQPYDALTEATGFEDDLLKKVLKKLLSKKWIKCLSSMTEDILYDDLDFDKDFRSIYYLATKSGLLAHNSQ
ncbi:MAG: hypothetical protein WBA74_02705 [Cyclobacteriaceae bacterium]